jgi:hypothetical protein
MALDQFVDFLAGRKAKGNCLKPGVGCVFPGQCPSPLEMKCLADSQRDFSPRVNSPKNDDPSLWEPLHSEPTQTTTNALELLRE